MEPTGTAVVGTAGGIDWERLRIEATRAAALAYAPYSRLRVGAAAMVDDGRLIVGCNVENASYGLGLCAECTLVGALYASGGGRLLAFVCVNGAGAPLAPCGRCRQLLYEHGGPDLLVALAGGPRALGELLPEAFESADLPASFDAAPGTPDAATGVSRSGNRGDAR